MTFAGTPFADLFGTSLVTVSVGYFFGRSFIQPIFALMRGTLAVSEGRLDERVTITSRDEFQQLGDAFNGMADGYRRMLNRAIRAPVLPLTSLGARIPSRTPAGCPPRAATSPSSPSGPSATTPRARLTRGTTMWSTRSPTTTSMPTWTRAASRPSRRPMPRSGGWSWAPASRRGPRGRPAARAEARRDERQASPSRRPTPVA